MSHPPAARFLGLVQACVAAALSLSSSALGQGGRLSLEWSAPSGCPDQTAVRRRIETLLGASADSLARGPVVVQGTVTVGAENAEVHLLTVVPNERAPDSSNASGTPGPPDLLNGERTIRGASCSEVSAAGALVIALAIDPKAVAEHRGQSATAAFDAPASPPAATPTPNVAMATPPPRLPPPLVAPLVATAPTPSGPRAEGLVEAYELGDLGSLPGPSFGSGLGAGFSTGRFATHLDAAYLFPRFAAAATSNDGRSRGADVSLVAIDLDGCYAAVPGTVEFDVCVGVETGVLLATGKGFERSTSAIAPWVGGLGSIGMVVRPLPRLTVRAGVGVLVPLGRSQIQFSETVGNSEQFSKLDRPSAVSGRACLGAGLSFW